jgi:hypothetical protein
MSEVLGNHAMRVEKRLLRFDEGDALLLAIEPVLVRVPFEARIVWSDMAILPYQYMA